MNDEQALRPTTQRRPALGHTLRDDQYAPSPAIGLAVGHPLHKRHYFEPRHLQCEGQFRRKKVAHCVGLTEFGGIVRRSSIADETNLHGDQVRIDVNYRLGLAKQPLCALLQPLFPRYRGVGQHSRAIPAVKYEDPVPSKMSFGGGECSENILVGVLITNHMEESQDTIKAAIEQQLANVLMLKGQPVTEVR